MIKAAIIGGSGYIGGELIRLLWMHPEVEVSTVTSRRYNGLMVHKVHPGLRGINLRFTDRVRGDVDIIFISLPHGESMRVIDEYIGSSKIIDLSADFRLNLSLYEEYYGRHLKPELIEEFTYGLPEIFRDEIRRSSLVANPGCSATAVILSLYPFRDLAREALVDVKFSSSAGGRRENILSSHPERSNVVRVYKAYKHRHEAEVYMVTGVKAYFTVYSVDIVRGLLASVYLKTDIDIGEIYRRLSIYVNEPFIRIIRDRAGQYRYPDPKYVIGSNYIDIGFEYDGENGRLILFSALDNLIKGGAGQAIQNMNLMFNFREDTGLRYLPIYPV